MDHRGPLAGMRVIELAHVMAGPERDGRDARARVVEADRARGHTDFLQRGHDLAPDRRFVPGHPWDGEQAQQAGPWRPWRRSGHGAGSVKRAARLALERSHCWVAEVARDSDRNWLWLMRVACSPAPVAPALMGRGRT